MAKSYPAGREGLRPPKAPRTPSSFFNPQSRGHPHLPLPPTSTVSTEPEARCCSPLRPVPQRWDEELAAFAKAYAQQCVWGHNKERGRRGENLFAITEEGMDVPLAMEEWHHEREHYNLSAATCDQGQMCGHYTQVRARRVGGATQRVGGASRAVGGAALALGGWGRGCLSLSQLQDQAVPALRPPRSFVEVSTGAPVLSTPLTTLTLEEAQSLENLDGPSRPPLTEGT